MQERGPCLHVSRHRARLDHRGPLPVLAAAFIVGQRGFDRDSERRRTGIGAQTQVSAKDVSVLRPVLEDAHKPPGQSGEEIDGFERVGDRRRVRIDEHDQVDVGRKIQLVSTELAHPKHDPAGAFCRRSQVWQADFAAAVRVLQQKADRCANARIRQVGEASYRHLRGRFTRQIG